MNMNTEEKHMLRSAGHTALVSAIFLAIAILMAIIANPPSVAISALLGIFMSLPFLCALLCYVGASR